MKLFVLALQSLLFVLLASTAAVAQTEKPLNFLMIWGDDIGYWNVSAYNQGMMGYETPNIDRIAQEGMLFTDAYGETIPRSIWTGTISCHAGKARRTSHRDESSSISPTRAIF